MNTPITVAMRVQGDAAASTPGGLWRMNFEEGITLRNGNCLPASSVSSLMLPKVIEPFDKTWSFSGSNVSKSPSTIIEVEPTCPAVIAPTFLKTSVSLTLF
jgi:hypothetical protein